MSTGHGRHINRIILADLSSIFKFLMDTDANISVLSGSLFPNATMKDDLVLFAANGTQISTFGTKTLKMYLNLRREFPWSFVIADVSQLIIGFDFFQVL